jgi:hypothetical protein
MNASECFLSPFSMQVMLSPYKPWRHIRKAVQLGKSSASRLYHFSHLGKRVRYALNRNLDILEQRKVSYTCRDSNPDSPARNLVTTWIPSKKKKLHLSSYSNFVRISPVQNWFENKQHIIAIMFRMWNKSQQYSI